MLEAIILIKIIFAAVAALAVVTIALLTFADILAWFQTEERQRLSQSDAENIAFTVLQSIEEKKCKVIQGVLSKRTGNVVEGRVIEAQKIDEELARIHAEEEVVIYT